MGQSPTIGVTALEGKMSLGLDPNVSLLTGSLFAIKALTSPWFNNFFSIVSQSKMKQADFWTALLRNTKRLPPRSVALNSFAICPEITLCFLTLCSRHTHCPCFVSRFRLTPLSVIIHVIRHAFNSSLRIQLLLFTLSP